MGQRLVNWGVARYRRNAMDDAVTAMRQALLRQPGHTAAAANLGAFLRLTGQAEAAEALVRAAIAAAACLWPSTAEAGLA